MYFDEILDHFKCGKKIRRSCWLIGFSKAIETIGEERIKKYYFGVDEDE